MDNRNLDSKDKTEVFQNGTSIVSTASIKDLNDAGKYTAVEAAKETNRKAANRRRRKNGQKPFVNEDKAQRISKAREIQNKLNEGSNFRMNNQESKRNNVVGDEFTTKVDVNELLGGSESHIRKPNDIACQKFLGLKAEQIQLLEDCHELLMNRVKAFDRDLVIDKASYVKFMNTIGALVINKKNSQSWKVKIAVRQEDGSLVDRVWDYKEASQHFVVPFQFGHAVNQFGRYAMKDLGITVEPVWWDYMNIGLIPPAQISAVSQKVEALYNAAGIRLVSGIAAEQGANGDIMTSSFYESTVDGEVFTAFKQFFRNVNVAEMLTSSLIYRSKIYKSRTLDRTVEFTEDLEQYKTDRIVELYTCAYDYSMFKEINKNILLSAMS